MKHLFRVENIDLCGSNWPLRMKMCNLSHFSGTKNNNFDTQKMLFFVVRLNFATSNSWQNYLNFQKQVLNWPKSREITWNQEKYAKKCYFLPNILNKSLKNWDISMGKSLFWLLLPKETRKIRNNTKEIDGIWKQMKKRPISENDKFRWFQCTKCIKTVILLCWF